ncbi:MAG TPA: preprotein translocase subunit SecG, partial [Oxalicibacterium sp.]|nr:preprotein translocase subunit SecG [Oxalicibacterium sp.]
SVQVLTAIGLIGLILVQHGKGADMGAAFGSGASGSLFGASGSSNFLSKATGIAAAIFFAATLGLAFTANRSVSSGNGGVMQNAPVSSVPGAAPAPATSTAPASPNHADKSSEIPK